MNELTERKLMDMGFIEIPELKQSDDVSNPIGYPYAQIIVHEKTPEYQTFTENEWNQYLIDIDCEMDDDDRKIIKYPVELCLKQKYDVILCGYEDDITLHADDDDELLECIQDEIESSMNDIFNNKMMIMQAIKKIDPDGKRFNTADFYR